ncbi:anti-phage dCTP deaminase [Arthrobacter liuii]|uniref:Deoxycytidylate deaminase n=1 Tax=Arthrobacter liuii TaxID=1476996 RepID=A0ABQ2AZY1_9MICC|nr:anti-phage dCTP deaminase [Arthrobacter liuii]GGI00611.1 deoxycytidylate deaminase [Arthrobacter liuii]
MLISDTREQDFEIVIGLVAPIGTDLDQVITSIENNLRVYGYDSTSIRLSKLLRGGTIESSGATEAGISGASYYEDRMNLGDLLRKKFNSGDAVAALAVANIVGTRKNATGSHSQRRRHAWILRTLKHEDEVKLLRTVYGSRFILVGVHQDDSQRALSLKHQVTYADPTVANAAAKVADLMARDEQDAINKLGQRVRETYSMADYFINMNDDPEREIARFASVLFGSPFETPTQDEQAMFHAFAESLRSADPGRQVGAVIADSQGLLLALGCNDVPAAGGSIPWPGSDGDARDFRRGYDFNKQMTNQTMSELLDILAESGALTENLVSLTRENRLAEVLGLGDGKVRKARIMSLIEFGRISHAEMTAITAASKLGTPVDGATLYTTAFPCHMCMRLIVASGIKKVVYVDPYPKSLAFEMYSEALSTIPSDDSRVLIAPFWGASWNIFRQAFLSEGRSRDKDGRFELPKPREQRMKLAPADPLLGAEETERQLLIAVVERLNSKDSPDEN